MLAEEYSFKTLPFGLEPECVSFVEGGGHGAGQGFPSPAAGACMNSKIHGLIKVFSPWRGGLLPAVSWDAFSRVF